MSAIKITNGENKKKDSRGGGQIVFLRHSIRGVHSIPAALHYYMHVTDIDNGRGGDFFTRGV